MKTSQDESPPSLGGRHEEIAIHRGADRPHLAGGGKRPEDAGPGLSDVNNPATWAAAYSGPRSLTTVALPANTVLSTEYGQGIAGTYQANSYSNYYCMLGYGGVDRWEDGRRYSGGRMFAFADGHAKFLRDPVLIEELDPANGNLQVQVREAYAGRGVYEIPDHQGQYPFTADTTPPLAPL